MPPEDETPQDQNDEQESQEGAEDQEGADDGDDDEQDEPLGPKGTQALNREKERRRTAEKELRAFKALGLTPDQISGLTAKGGQKGGDAPDPDKIRQEARAEVTAEMVKDRVADKIEVAAAKGFADAEDARLNLLAKHDVADFLDGDGKIDTEAIQDALNDLLAKKPHLGAQGSKKFGGGADGGARKDSDKAKQLSRDDIKGWAPEKIEAARVAGRLDDLLAGKR